MRRTASRLLAVSSIVLLAMSASARTRPHQGGTLRVEMRADASQWINGAVRSLVFDSLTRLDGSGQAQPWLATRWESQSDGRRWQFWLRGDVRFHDGTPLSPATVVQSLTARDCAGCPWQSIHVAGDSVVFESESAVPNLPALLSNTRYGVDRRDEAGNLVGTGAFKFSASANGTVTLVAVEDGWHARPYANAIELHGGRSLRDQWMDVSVGRADLVEVPAETLRRAQQEHMRVVASRNTELLALIFDESDAAAQNPRLRAALALSVDRAALLNGIYQKQGESTASVLPNWLSGYSFVLPSAADINKAKGLRAEAEHVPELTLSVDASDPVLQLVADRIILNARDAGIAVRAVPLASRSTLRLARVHTEQQTPSAAFNEVAGQLSREVRFPADDITAVFRAEQELLGRHTVIPLVYTPRAFALSARVHDFVLASDGSLREADFWVEETK